jgi:TolB-like protein
LLALVRQAPALVRRDDLLSSVWPGEFVSDETLSQRVRLLRKSLGDDSDKPRYIESVRGWGYRLVPTVETAPASEEPIRALAVLPLANLTAGGEQEYLADGFTDALLTSLAKLGALKVISRTSVMRYRNTDKPVPRIAEELGVQALVEGSVLRSGCRVWVTVQLVRAATDEHIWAESYERDIADVPSLLNEVAATIADAIRLAVTPDERSRLMRQRRVDPVAYDAFLRGLWLLGRYTPSDLDQAMAHFDAAVAQDPSFAMGHAGVAVTYMLRALPLGAGLTIAEQHGLMARAKAAALRAVESDDSLAACYTVLGQMLLLQDWDWKGAREMLDRAIRLEPSSAMAHFARSFLAACLGEQDVVRSEGERAITLDPLNLVQRAEFAEQLYWVRDYQGAIHQANDTLAFEASFPRAHFVLGRVHEAQSRIPEAIGHYVKAGLLTEASAQAARAAFKRGGVRGFHRWALNAGMNAQGGPAAGARRPGAPIRSIWWAKLHAQAANIDEAIECLERAYEERDYLLPIVTRADFMDPLRGDPRFQELVGRIGIPSGGVRCKES